MLKPLEDLPPGMLGVRAVGRVSKTDYVSVLEPMLRRADDSRGPVTFLYELGDEFERFTLGAMLRDARLARTGLRTLEGCAVVTDLGGMRRAVRIASALLPCSLQSFPRRQRGEAIEWLQSLPEGGSVSHRLHADTGVIVAEVEGPLRIRDFDALELTADSWIRKYGRLEGLLIHAPCFRGWENLGSFLRHVRFVREHHTRVRRVALVTNNTVLARLMPRLARLLFRAHVRGFSEDQRASALAWVQDAAANEQRSPATTPSASA